MNNDWLERMRSLEGEEKQRHLHLFLVKLLHEYGHLLTPLFMDNLGYPRNTEPSDFAFDTPPKVGTVQIEMKRKKNGRTVLEKKVRLVTVSKTF